MTVLQLSIKLMLFIAVGYAARRLKVMADGFDKALTRFVMAVPLPCMVANSFRIEYSADKLLETPLLLGLSVGSMALLFGLATLLTRGAKTKLGKTARFALMVFSIFPPVYSHRYLSDMFIRKTVPLRSKNPFC